VIDGVDASGILYLAIEDFGKIVIMLTSFTQEYPATHLQTPKIDPLFGHWP
jgi:hypothetical protein